MQLLRPRTREQVDELGADFRRAFEGGVERGPLLVVEDEAIAVGQEALRSLSAALNNNSRAIRPV